jgi:acyl-CoA synthetase (AMP-forming)/AMP-acid ligase II
MTMPAIDAVMARFADHSEMPALFWRGRWFAYDELGAMIETWALHLQAEGVTAGTVCAVVSDYSPQTAALFFALMRARAVIVPFLRQTKQSLDDYLEIAGVETVVRIDQSDEWTIERRAPASVNPLVVSFRDRQSPGLIVFTSGSTGTPKGILHDVERVMRKFVAPRQGWRTVLFLMMDHFGGFNSLLSAFAYGGVGVCVPDRSPDAVCAAIEASRATLLPTTPTFLNLLIASGSYRRHDLSSIQLITYGTEVMNDATLHKVREVFPAAAVKQTYGLSELGVLRSKSESDDSLFVRVGGDGFEVKVIDDVLWIRSEANMVGYLNAPNPFDADGWMCTGDQVEVRGDYMRILGRKSELIFVGGDKVFPAEVEAVILRDANVRDVTVYGVGHPVMGKIVQARVSLHSPEDSRALTTRLRRLCLEQLARFKVPVRFLVVDEEAQRSERFKKIRRIDEDEGAAAEG